MATRKQKAAPKKNKPVVKKKAAPKKKPVAKKTSAPKKPVAKKSAPKKPVAKKAPSKPAKFDPERTQQLSFTEIIGDIEERQALDRLEESK